MLWYLGPNFSENKEAEKETDMLHKALKKALQDHEIQESAEH